MSRNILVLHQSSRSFHYFKILFSRIKVEASNSEMNSDGIVYRLQMASDGGEDVFSVDAESGVVYVVMEDGLDAEKVKQYTLIVEAVDERGTYYR